MKSLQTQVLSRRVVVALALVLAVVTGSLGAATDARESRQLTGWVTHVRDGDTIEVNGAPVRLNGLHAPELSEPGGTAARVWMVEHTRGQQVVCTLNGERTHDRRVGTCANRDGDLALQLIKAGLGRDCPRYSRGRYAMAEPRSVKSMPLPGYCRSR